MNSPHSQKYPRRKSNGNFFSDNKQIKEILDPTDNQDAVTLNYYNTNLPIFGTEFQFIENNIVTTTTLASYINKIDFTTNNLIGGEYLIGWNYGWNSNSRKDNFDAIIVLDNDFNTDNLISSKFETVKKDAGAGLGRFINTGTSQLFNESGFRRYNLSSGIHNIKLEFRTSKSGKKMSIWDAILYIYRVI